MYVDMGISVPLREILRMDTALELAMTGRILSGVEAAELGLVTRVHNEPFNEAMKLAEEIAKRSPDSVAFNKRLFQNTFRGAASETDALALETLLQKKLLGSYNQLAAVSRVVGPIEIPYKDRMHE